MKQASKRFWGVMLLAGCISLSMASLAWSDSDDADEGGNKNSAERGEGGFARSTGVALVTNKQYKDECSACHFAYQPGFLPERSWVKIMGSLDDHFGENAQLDEATRISIENYLRGHAADHVPNRFSRSFLRSIGDNETPMRISGTPYFERKHRGIPARMVRDNPKVRSFANCASCHTGAASGTFDESGVVIPGFGRWDD
jgi:Dihaem cytochrome c